MAKPTAVKRAWQFSARGMSVLVAMTIMAAMLFLGNAPAQAAQANLAWDAAAGSNITGYKVHIGGTSGNYQQHIDVGNTTSYTTGQLNEGSTYYFAVTAYNSSGMESAYSNEISRTIAVQAASYTVTASAGSGGTITALNNAGASTATDGSWTVTSVRVSDGASQSFGITPAAGYRISAVTVDGASVGAVSSYTFSNVKANHTMSASFAAIPETGYTISASAGPGGTISPAGNVAVSKGGSKTFAITPNAGYSIKSLQVDGKWIAAASSYTFSNVAANHTILAAFQAGTTAPATSSYTVSAAAGPGGTISPAGNVAVSKGGSKTFAITPSAGYSIKSLQVDGKWIAAASSYTFSNVTANHTILAAFQAGSTGTATAGGQVVFTANSGGASFKDAAGITYGSDSRYSGGSTKTITSSISGTSDDKLYQSYRYGNSFSYNIPLAKGAYSVVLKFADNSGTGQRIFDVRMEGRTVLDNFDIYARSGNNTAYEVTIPVDVADGTLNLDFVSSKGNAKINAVVVKTR